MKDLPTGATMALPAEYTPVQQRPIQPSVVDRWMDAEDGYGYGYRADRPLGPMISENAGTAREVGGGADGGGGAGKVRISRDELMGLNMELDSLIDD